MAVEATVRVRGLTPLIRDLSRFSKDGLSKPLRARLRELAFPVMTDAKERERDGQARVNPTGLSDRTVEGVKIRVRERGVSVEQTVPRTSNLAMRRPAFGVWQMRNAFLPALEDHAEEIERGAGELLDELFRDWSIGGHI